MPPPERTSVPDFRRAANRLLQLTAKPQARLADAVSQRTVHGGMSEQRPEEKAMVGSQHLLCPTSYRAGRRTDIAVNITNQVTGANQQADGQHNHPECFAQVEFGQCRQQHQQHTKQTTVRTQTLDHEPSATHIEVQSPFTQTLQIALPNEATRSCVTKSSASAQQHVNAVVNPQRQRQAAAQQPDARKAADSPGQGSRDITSQADGHDFQLWQAGLLSPDCSGQHQQSLTVRHQLTNPAQHTTALSRVAASVASSIISMGGKVNPSQLPNQFCSPALAALIDHWQSAQPQLLRSAGQDKLQSSCRSEPASHALQTSNTNKQAVASTGQSNLSSPPMTEAHLQESRHKSASMRQQRHPQQSWDRQCSDGQATPYTRGQSERGWRRASSEPPSRNISATERHEVWLLQSQSLSQPLSLPLLSPSHGARVVRPTPSDQVMLQQPQPSLVLSAQPQQVNEVLTSAAPSGHCRNGLAAGCQQKATSDKSIVGGKGGPAGPFDDEAVPHSGGIITASQPLSIQRSPASQHFSEGLARTASVDAGLCLASSIPMTEPYVTQKQSAKSLPDDLQESLQTDAEGDGRPEPEQKMRQLASALLTPDKSDTISSKAASDHSDCSTAPLADLPAKEFETVTAREQQQSIAPLLSKPAVPEYDFHVESEADACGTAVNEHHTTSAAVDRPLGLTAVQSQSSTLQAAEKAPAQMPAMPTGPQANTGDDRCRGKPVLTAAPCQEPPSRLYAGVAVRADGPTGAAVGKFARSAHSTALPTRTNASDAESDDPDFSIRLPHFSNVHEISDPAVESTKTVRVVPQQQCNQPSHTTRPDQAILNGLVDCNSDAAAASSTALTAPGIEETADVADVTSARPCTEMPMTADAPGRVVSVKGPETANANDAGGQRQATRDVPPAAIVIPASNTADVAPVLQLQTVGQQTQSCNDDDAEDEAALESLQLLAVRDATPEAVTADKALACTERPTRRVAAANKASAAAARAAQAAATLAGGQFYKGGFTVIRTPKTTPPKGEPQAKPSATSRGKAPVAMTATSVKREVPAETQASYPKKAGQKSLCAQSKAAPTGRAIVRAASPIKTLSTTSATGLPVKSKQRSIEQRQGLKIRKGVTKQQQAVLKAGKAASSQLLTVSVADQQQLSRKPGRGGLPQQVTAHSKDSMAAAADVADGERISLPTPIPHNSVSVQPLADTENITARHSNDSQALRPPSKRRKIARPVGSMVPNTPQTIDSTQPGTRVEVSQPANKPDDSIAPSRLYRQSVKHPVPHLTAKGSSQPQLTSAINHSSTRRRPGRSVNKCNFKGQAVRSESREIRGPALEGDSGSGTPHITPGHAPSPALRQQMTNPAKGNEPPPGAAVPRLSDQKKRAGRPLGSKNRTFVLQSSKFSTRQRALLKSRSQARASAAAPAKQEQPRAEADYVKAPDQQHTDLQVKATQAGGGHRKQQGQATGKSSGQLHKVGRAIAGQRERQTSARQPTARHAHIKRETVAGDQPVSGVATTIVQKARVKDVPLDSHPRKPLPPPPAGLRKLAKGPPPAFIIKGPITQAEEDTLRLSPQELGAYPLGHWSNTQVGDEPQLPPTLADELLRRLQSVMHSRGVQLAEGWKVRAKTRPLAATETVAARPQSGKTRSVPAQRREAQVASLDLYVHDPSGARARSLAQAATTAITAGRKRAFTVPFVPRSVCQSLAVPQQTGDSKGNSIPSRHARKAEVSVPAAKSQKNTKRLSGLPPHMTQAAKGPRGDTPTSSADSALRRGSGGASGAASLVPGQASGYQRYLSRIRANLYHIRRETGAIETYQADWSRGAARDRVKPNAALALAQRQVERCKLHIRAAIRACEEGDGGRAIPSEAFDADGGVDQKDIFCCVCNIDESVEGNDIILCDGPCNRGYHERCLDPPLDASTLADVESWLCPACDTKDDAMDLINVECGTSYDVSTPWDAVFAEEASQDSRPAAPIEAPTVAAQSGTGVTGDGGLLGADWPEDDDNDSDFEGSEVASDTSQKGGAATDASPSALDSNDSSDSGSGGSAGSRHEGEAAADLPIHSIAAGKSWDSDGLTASGSESPPRRQRRKRASVKQAPVRLQPGRRRAITKKGARVERSQRHRSSSNSRSVSAANIGRRKSRPPRAAALAAAAAEAAARRRDNPLDAFAAAGAAAAAVAASIAAATADSVHDAAAGGRAARLKRAAQEDSGGSEGLILNTKRRRTAVDYQALNKVMFGDFEAFEGENDGKDGSEEDWGPHAADLATPRHADSQ